MGCADLGSITATNTSAEGFLMSFEVFNPTGGDIYWSLSQSTMTAAEVMAGDGLCPNSASQASGSGVVQVAPLVGEWCGLFIWAAFFLVRVFDALLIYLHSDSFFFFIGVELSVSE